jgi:hypothetical protein
MKHQKIRVSSDHHRHNVRYQARTNLYVISRGVDANQYRQNRCNRRNQMNQHRQNMSRANLTRHTSFSMAPIRVLVTSHQKRMSTHGSCTSVVSCSAGLVLRQPRLSSLTTQVWTRVISTGNPGVNLWGRK